MSGSMCLPDVAALAGVGDDVGAQRAALLDHGLEVLAHGRVAGGLADQVTEVGRRPRRAHLLGQRGEDDQQVLAQVARVGGGDVGEVGGGDGEEERLPGGPPAVDGGLADAGPGGDGLDGGAGEALLGEERPGGLHHRDVDPGVTGTPESTIVVRCLAHAASSMAPGSSSGAASSASAPAAASAARDGRNT